MKTLISLILCISCFLLSSCKQKFPDQKHSSSANSSLLSGTGIVDITGDSAVILDPLHVKAVVLKQGDVQVALAECDQTMVSSDLLLEARQKASEKTGIPVNNISVSSTHTHMASPHKDLVPAIVQAISDAQANLKPVRIQSALGQQFNVSFNRRYYMKDGSVVFNPMFLNPDIVRPVGPIDAEVGIIMISDSSTGKPVTSLLNFPLHLDIVKEYGAVYTKSGAGSRNSVSADYPYFIEQSLRQDFGDSFNSIFFTGCCGNINHWDFSKPGPQSGHMTKSKQVGDSLYASIKRALPLATEQKPSLAILSEIVKVPL
jgi:hypothetical protein